MYYPAFEVPFVGGPTLIAVIAITHVFIAHFAVGAGLFNAIVETHALRRDRPLLRQFLHDYSRVIVLLPFILGAVTGVGIWFSIALVAPRATSLLIHNFVWAWAIEWVCFLVEIAAGYVYYYSWDRLSPRRHAAVGWIYAVAAWMSLFVINGIITFMLTPGDWSDRRAAGDYSGAFWTGLFNPTFLPSLLLRSVSCLALAGIFVCVVVNVVPRYSREERTTIIHTASHFLVPLVLMVPAAMWYLGQVPASARGLAFGGAAAMSLFFIFGLTCSVLLAVYAYVALVRKRGYVSLETSLLLAAMAFIATGSMEYVREGIRKPYVVRGYLWSNEIANQPAELARLNAEGVLAHAPWIAPADRRARADRLTRGRWMFDVQCAKCHTIDGLNGVAPLIAGWPRDLIRYNLDHLDKLKGFMPPVVGTPQEKDDLADWLFRLNPVHHEPTASPLASGVEGQRR
ncbi:MAG: cytochrome ubiquinol oxidase subunit I [Phycisphaerae bacterium]|nr:cytochrome ubiquinol oxidase subunit I [Phycisphaerae bacterium]